MMFGEILNSIIILNVSIIAIEGVGGKTDQKNAAVGIRNLFELVNKQFDDNLRKLTTEQEEKIDSELEYLFTKLKELEDVVNERI